MEALGLAHAALDLLEGPNGPVIIEVNPTVGFWLELERDGIASGTSEALAETLLSATL